MRMLTAGNWKLMKIQFTISLLLLTIMSAMAQSVIEPCKYGQPLITALQENYAPDNPLGYSDGRDILYSQIDNNGLELSGIYTGFTITLDPDEDPSVSAFQGGNGLNAEHVYPQSKGAGSEPAKSDLHNIFPCKVNVNEARESCPFGDVDDTDTDSWYYLDMQTSSIPSSGIDNYSEKDAEDCVFEPREAVKGNIARAVFYFYAIYQSTADAINPEFFASQTETLYQWHLEDPPDDKEYERNSLIASEQGNLNPFIEDSSLVRRAFFEADADLPDGHPDCYDAAITSVLPAVQSYWATIATTIVHHELVIQATKPVDHAFIYNLQGKLVGSFNPAADGKIDVAPLSRGIYILQLRNGSQLAAFTFLKW